MNISSSDGRAAPGVGWANRGHDPDLHAHGLRRAGRPTRWITFFIQLPIIKHLVFIGSQAQEQAQEQEEGEEEPQTVVQQP